MKQTFKQANSAYLYYDTDTKEHMVWDKDTKEIEVYVARKNHASWGLKYKNTHLEFCATWEEERTKRFVEGLKRITRWGEQHPSFKMARLQLIRMEEYN
jgi:hypothetical protein